MNDIKVTHRSEYDGKISSSINGFDLMYYLKNDSEFRVVVKEIVMEMIKENYQNNKVQIEEFMGIKNEM